MLWGPQPAASGRRVIRQKMAPITSDCRLRTTLWPQSPRVAGRAAGRRTAPKTWQ